MNPYEGHIPEEVLKVDSELRHQRLLEQYSKELEQIPHIGKELQMEREGSVAEQDINYDNLVFIRADSFQPKVEGDGLKIENALDATNGEIERFTNHFTLNHKVTANSGGEWNSSPLLFITPGKSMVETNGKPENLYSIDSYYTKSVALPEGSVIIYKQGHRPELGDLANKYTLLELDEQTPDKEVLSLVLQKMGYTEIQGGAWSATDRFASFDKAITKFAAEQGIDSAPHFGSRTQTWEDARQFIKDGKPYFALGRAYDMRIPEELRMGIAKDAFAAFDSDANNETKQSLVDAINEIVVDDVPDKDKILEQVPLSGWKFIYDGMTAKIGMFDGYTDKSAVDQTFQEIYGRKIPV